MRKALLSLLIACMGLFPCHAGPGDGGDVRFPTGSGNVGHNGGIRPRIPSDPDRCVYVSYDPDSASLEITTPEGTGPVFIAIQNLTTGENYGYPFHISDRFHTIPFMGGEGIWRISLASLVPHDCSIICIGLFNMDNGIISEY